MNEVTVEIDTPILGGDIPAGGSTGEVLTKRSDMDLDYGWEPISQPEGVELKSNKVQSIGEGSATEYPSTNAVKTFVDAGLSSKQDAVAGKGLSTNDFTDADKARLGAAITDAPSDGLLYGRNNGGWSVIPTLSGLVVVITHPEGVDDNAFDIIIRADGSATRYTYTGGAMGISVPAGKRILVAVVAPNGYTSPRPLAYDSQIGVTHTYNAQSEEITNGLYVLTADKSLVPQSRWDTDFNTLAVGVGVVTSSSRFVFSLRAASLTSDAGTTLVGEGSPTKAYFGSYGFDCGSIGIQQFDSAATAQGVICGRENSEKMVAEHKENQPNWMLEDISNSYSHGFFPAAMCAYKFKTAIDENYGNWRLPDCVETSVVVSNKSAILGLLNLLGDGANAANNAINNHFIVTACPISNNNEFIFNNSTPWGRNLYSQAWRCNVVLPFREL